MKAKISASENVYRTHFGNSVSNALTETGTTQVNLAASAGLSQPYLNQMMTGAKKPAPEWVDIIASTLRLSEKKRRALHKAAAIDNGFKL